MAAGPPRAFRSFAWGAAPDASLRKYMGSIDGEALYAPNSATRLADLFGVSVASELYHFDRDRFYLGQAFLNGRESFLKMKAALTAAYGKPALRNDLTEVYTWQWDSAKVEVRFYYQPKYATSTVEFRCGRR